MIKSYIKFNNEHFHLCINSIKIITACFLTSKQHASQIYYSYFGKVTLGSMSYIVLVPVLRTQQMDEADEKR